jgi:HD-GYP domain-containing protein (c-di-GMP phosphodiesterase class II)
MNTVASDQPGLVVSAKAMRFFPVEVATIDDGMLEMDVYLDSAGDGSQFVLYCAKGNALTYKLREKLIPMNVAFLYVPLHQHKEYRKTLTRHIAKVYRDPGKKQAERVRIVRDACAKMIDDVLLFPERPESLETVREVSQQFADWVQEDQAGFSYLMDMAAHDYYTVTHMVNVGMGCGLLAKRLRPDDTEWHSLIIEGGLLHDVGKRQISPEILNKEGRLSLKEWELIKSHPDMGSALISAHRNIPQIVVDMVVAHHERMDGGGYPTGLSNGRISEAARICAVVDAFDAVCSSRPYRGPTPPEQTLSILAEGRGTQFDPHMVELWSNVVRELIHADPSRAPCPPAESEQSEPLSLADFIQQAPGGGTRVGSRGRRRYRRFDCCLTARVRWLESGTQDPAKSLAWSDALVVDLGQGGARVSMALPLECDEILELELRAPGRPPVYRTARVVHVSVEPGPRWNAGLMFVQPPAGPPPV